MIGKSLRNIIKEEIKEETLKKKLIEFVDYHSKKKFPFGDLVVLHYNIYNGAKTEEIYKVAAAIEALILSFDMLDDFEDRDSEDTPWAIESNVALNATTALIYLSTIIINNTSFKNKDKSISILLKYSLLSINGQHIDLLNRCKNESEYIDMTMKKSGSLVALACLIGSVLADDEYPIAIETYAKYIGVIGQINNDLADIKKWREKNDLINRKFTLPIIYLLDFKDEELHFVHEYYAGNIEKDVILKNKELISKKFVGTGAIIYTEAIKKLYQNKVINELKKLNFNKYHINLLSEYIY